MKESFEQAKLIRQIQTNRTPTCRTGCEVLPYSPSLIVLLIFRKTTHSRMREFSVCPTWILGARAQSGEGLFLWGRNLACLGPSESQAEPYDPE